MFAEVCFGFPDKTEEILVRKEWLYVDSAIVARKGHELWEDVCN